MDKLLARNPLNTGTFPTQNAPSKLLSVNSIPLLVEGFIFLVVLNIIATVLYNVYFHPLSKYPGPKYAATTNWIWHIITIKGDQPHWVRKQHEKYGDLVRVGPDRLSFIDPQAWKDIYGHRSAGRQENCNERASASKDPNTKEGENLSRGFSLSGYKKRDQRFYGKEENGEDTLITTASAADHGRLRKIFSNAFSDRALKLQEPLIKKYVDQLISNIHRLAKEDKDVKLDMVKQYNFTTFDIMGELAFGEPLGMLDKGEYTPWVTATFNNVKAGVIARMGLEYPTLRHIMSVLMPKSLSDSRKMHFQHSVERVDRRLSKGITKDKPDIWNLVLEKGQDQLSKGQMYANSALFMLAGTETTATLLSGLTYHLLKNPEKLQRAVDEIRALAEHELTLEQLPRLPYLNACFEEGLRLYPPIPVGMPRQMPAGGNVVCGEWLPENTIVMVPQVAAYLSARNFKDADAFIPERWLPDSGYGSDRKETLQPFLFGPRNCVGKNLAYHEMRIILAKILWHFDLELCPESSDWANQKVWIVWEKPALLCKVKPVR
ncbi:cytochrome P450 [Macrophomina phaseolina]|uniref:Cytochrome P450 n=1 Tax=Macrophomina phaseolina TaxID=35725 RepID=A0ABQ8FTU0_9PEZI|nr:cytochrome P450 [Macrophomina phaseolina]